MFHYVAQEWPQTLRLKWSTEQTTRINVTKRDLTCLNEHESVWATVCTWRTKGRLEVSLQILLCLKQGLSVISFCFACQASWTTLPCSGVLLSLFPYPGRSHRTEDTCAMPVASGFLFVFNMVLRVSSPGPHYLNGKWSLSSESFPQRLNWDF